MKRYLPTKNLREAYLLLQNHQCYYCGKSIDINNMAMDHILPYSLYDFVYKDKNNFIASCGLCNRIKSNKDFDSFDDIRTHIHKCLKKRKQPIYDYKGLQQFRIFNILNKYAVITDSVLQKLSVFCLDSYFLHLQPVHVTENVEVDSDDCVNIEYISSESKVSDVNMIKNEPQIEIQSVQKNVQKRRKYIIEQLSHSELNQKIKECYFKLIQLGLCKP